MLYMHLRQLFRKPTRTALYLAVLILLTAFFCASLNLYKDSQYNLQLANETYTTIAVMELCADVDMYGNLLQGDSLDNYAGNQSLTVYGYDLEPIVTAPNVKKYELRARYGAFSEDNIALSKDGEIPIFNGDIIRFQLKSSENIIIDEDGSYNSANEYRVKDGYFYLETGSAAPKFFTLDVIDSAVDAVYYRSGDNGSGSIRVMMPFRISDDMIAAHYAKNLERLGYSPDTNYELYFEPDTEYIACVMLGYVNDAEKGNLLDGLYRVSSINFWRDELFCKRDYVYSKKGIDGIEGIAYLLTENHPYWIQKYEYVKENPDDLEKFNQIGRAYYINMRSFAVMTTNDIGGIPAFNLGRMYIKDGRAISAVEYASGAKVCMISREFSKVQGWKIGSKIDFNFYTYHYFTNATLAASTLQPRYTYTSPNQFFDSGEYEVVGIYDVRPMIGSSTISEAAISVPWNTIYIPEKSLTNAPAEEDRPVTGALLTIWLENGKIEPFIERMNKLGITGAKQGDYEARFTFYDQGYSRIQPSLEALSGTAELLLILSSSLLVIAALLLAFFYAQSQKQSIGTMRLLGCSKARAFAAVMLSALIIAVTGALIGAAIGHALTASVGESIMANANQTPEEFLAFSAYLAESTQVEVEFALGADAKVSLLTCLAALGLFIVGTLVFVIRYLGKGPRELLPRAGE